MMIKKDRVLIYHQRIMGRMLAPLNINCVGTPRMRRQQFFLLVHQIGFLIVDQISTQVVNESLWLNNGIVNSLERIGLISRFFYQRPYDFQRFYFEL